MTNPPHHHTLKPAYKRDGIVNDRTRYIKMFVCKDFPKCTYTEAYDLSYEVPR